jgi:hypothetical protein
MQGIEHLFIVLLWYSTAIGFFVCLGQVGNRLATCGRFPIGLPEAPIAPKEAAHRLRRRHYVGQSPLKNCAAISQDFHFWAGRRALKASLPCSRLSRRLFGPCANPRTR